MNVTLWDTSSDVRKELSIQDDRTESDNRIEVMLLIGIAENNLPHIARWESTKPPYAEPHVRWCGRSVNVKIGGKCLLWLAFTSYPIDGSIWIRYFPSLYLTGRFLPACLSCEWFVNSPAIYSFYSWENQSLRFSIQVCPSWFLWNRGCLPCRPLLGVAEVFDGNLVCFFLVEGPRKTQGIKKYNIYEEFVKC